MKRERSVGPARECSHFKLSTDRLRCKELKAGHRCCPFKARAGRTKEEGRERGQVLNSQLSESFCCCCCMLYRCLLLLLLLLLLLSFKGKEEGGTAAAARGFWPFIAIKILPLARMCRSDGRETAAADQRQIVNRWACGRRLESLGEMQSFRRTSATSSI